MAASTLEFDQQMMRRAIRLAMNGRGLVEPNPMVGCVIVKDGRIIGEGHTQKFGQAHAEPTALANCTESPQGATAYTTLEPCCHTNKKTPPCVPRLIEAGIKRVVAGCTDPNPDVNGKGLALLRAAGIDVTWPMMEAEGKQLIAPFLAWINHRRPYVTLKWAQTADGKVAGAGKKGLVDGTRVQISNSSSMHLVHELRARSDAIIVGHKTIVIDDPLLTARGVENARPLLRVGLASRRGPFLSNQLASSVAHGPILLYCTPEALNIDAQAARKIEQLKVPIQLVTATADGLIDLNAVLTDLFSRHVMHVLVEPGPTLAANFLNSGLVDRLWVFQSPNTLNEPGRIAAQIPSHFAVTGQLDIAGDRLTEYLNPTSAVYFAPTPSADFTLASEATGGSMSGQAVD